MSNQWIVDEESFHDFLRFAIEYAPNFPAEDYLEQEEQLDLKKAFGELTSGLRLLKDHHTADTILEVRQAIDEAMLDYLAGDDFSGSRKLQDIARRLLPEM